MTEKKMQLVDWLDDLCVRFIINLPQEELESVERICFQIEEAQWFYEDFIRPADPSLPQLHLSEFASRLMKHCPLTAGYSDDLHALAFKQFMAYKTRVPVRGAILLDEDMDKVLLVKGYKKNATWSFPRGKINKDEDDLICAIREVWEETGYDIEKAGLVPLDRKVHAIDVTMREQHLRMFVFRAVPLDTPFEPQTRKEISKIQWYKLSGLPTYHNKRRSQYASDGAEPDTIAANKLYMVAPFLPSLKRWINQQKKLDAQRPPQFGIAPRDLQDVPSDVPLEDDRRTQPPVAEVSNPADELKRLLSLGSIPQQASLAPFQNTMPSADGHQADALLAMLRGSSSATTQPATLPRTPMEQILGQPSQPQSPHVHHVKSSPLATWQPPPEFPLSPNRQAVQNATRSMAQMGLNGFPTAQPENMPFAGHQAQYPQTNQPQQNNLPPFAQTHLAQNHAPQQTPQSQYPDSSQMLPSLQPQGHGAIAHGPAAPKASQLPPPSMNSHALSLLNAFKTPSHRPQQQYQQQPFAHNQNEAQMQQFPSQGTSQSFAPPIPSTASFHNVDAFPPAGPHSSGSPQHSFPGQMPQNGPSRSNHQNSLLEMFKSPNAQKATPVTQRPTHLSEQDQYRAASVQVSQQVQSPLAASAEPTAAPVKQRSATVAMMTRTLPKVRAPSPTKVKMSQKGAQFDQGSIPAKEATKLAQTSSLNDFTPGGQQLAATETNKPNIKILSRPESRPGSAATPKISSMPPPNQMPSPRKNRTSKVPGQGAVSNFTILQRPSPSKIKQIVPPSLPTSEETSKPFQPQLLRRPKADEGGTGSASHTKQVPHRVPSSTDQRDTLLALFSQTSQGRVKSIDQGVARAGPSSSGSASPLPTDPAAFRSRIASNASAISNGEGLRSPATPVEAKGFLLDYLNGVVKGEQYRGAKRA